MVPASRITAINEHPLAPAGDYVLYWMIANRRTSWNFALDRALEHAAELRKPLVVLEALRVDHRWASDRFHQFVVDGMRDNQRAFAGAGVTYLPYLEPVPGQGRGLLSALAERAAVVVTDEFPCFFLPGMVAAAGRALRVRLEAVDANGLLPLRAVDTVSSSAHVFRRTLQRTLPAHLQDRPAADPLAELDRRAAAPRPASIIARWPDALAWLDAGGAIADLPIDHTVAPVETRGGHTAARARLEAFLRDDLHRYGVERNHPEREAASRLSPYLHWGHLAAHEIFAAVMSQAGWLGNLPSKATGSREGWWGVGAAAESFLDELVTWREIGFNMASKRADYDRFESLPDWARKTLDAHETDHREWRYDLPALEQARTHDLLWNAAQRQLVTDGRIHNYLRMLWGKKILQWTASAREALAIMIELNNKFALDGRDPNSYSGIFWTLGRYDRPWFPERDVFGVVRYMSSENTARKYRVKDYIARYHGTGQT
ncbi:MAG: deoxyribodipyrimidine photolyase [Vicinamibacterales bacterium]